MSYRPANFALIEDLLRQVEVHLEQKSLSELRARDLAIRKHYGLPITDELVPPEIIRTLDSGAPTEFAMLGVDQADHNETWSGEYPEVTREMAVNFVEEALLDQQFFCYIVAPDGTIVRVPYEILTSRNGRLLFLTGEIEFTAHGVVFGSEGMFHTSDIEMLFAGEACSPRYPLPAAGSGSFYADATRGSIPDSPVQRASSGGRPPKFDWDAVWIEICRLLHFEGAPGKQAELIEHLQLWSQNRLSEDIGTTTLKRKISNLYKELGLRDQGP